MSAKEIARLAGVKEPYAYNVLGQLRKASELQTA
jgi:sugar-specific transcriptional regulator TrmB